MEISHDLIALYWAEYWSRGAVAVRSFAWSVSACVAMAVLEWRWSTGHRAGVRGRSRNLGLGLAVATLVVTAEPALAAIVSAAAGRAGEGLLWSALPEVLRRGAAGAVLGVLLYALLWDLFQYWAHRLQHTVPWLWALHRVHHDDPAVNATTALRQHPGAVLLGFALTAVPTAALCGLHALPAAGALVLFAAWGYVNHADLRLPLGPLTGVISGPQWHRLHHAADPAYHGCNYAAFFPWLDRVFGTYRAPRRGEFPRTGVGETG